MKRLLIFLCIFFVASSSAFSQERKEEKSANLRQYASGKFGFYFPSDGLNNGLLFGIDGITEFIHHGFILSGAIDLYPKQSIDIFKNPKPNIAQQTMVLLPIHVNFGYQFFDVPDADTRGYIGVGGGYYFYFYNVDYRSSGGLFGTLNKASQRTVGVFSPQRLQEFSLAKFL